MKPTCLSWLQGVALFILCSCGSIKPYYSPDENGRPVDPSADVPARYSLYLVGGVHLGQSSPVLQAVLGQAGSPSGLVLLGDVMSIDDCLRPGTTDAEFPSGVLDEIHQADRSFNDFYLVPGYREWSSGKKTSVRALDQLDKLLKDVKRKGRLLVPAKECGQPEVVRLTDRMILVLVDSQWALETETHPGVNMPGCELENVLALRLALKDIIQSHTSDQIIIATHHPIFANGRTAGNYPLVNHLLPLPVVGTFVTGIQSMTGDNQHFGHPAYEAYRSVIRTVVDNCKNCVVVSGHEQSMQYFNEAGKAYLVAGSGSRMEHARRGERSGFSYMHQGYARVDELEDGNYRLSFYAVEASGAAWKVWEKLLDNPLPAGQAPIPVASSPLRVDSMVMPASTRYTDKHFLRGDFYRAAWSLPVNLPLLWIDDVYGGLKPLQLGGGNQTRSLRLENEKGEQYVLRSIDKKVTTVLPRALRGSFAENIVQDGIAASHPYGALVVPALAKASGVYYTNPRIVYVPHQPALGVYDQDIGDGVYLFEERPGGNTSGFENFGYTHETFSTSDVIEMLAEDHDVMVDQQAVLRARLLDIWLGDWDRHDDQWRWASFRENHKTILRPIPRDRDQVFFKNDGVLDYLASRPYFNPALRLFSSRIDHLAGLIWAAKYFDRSFLHELKESDFIDAAKKMQEALSDYVIARAFTSWPKAIDSLDGPDIRHDLRVRRDDLVFYARQFYRLISKVVFLPCTADKDIIRLQVLDDGHLDISIHRVDKGVVYPYYHRLFDDRVTREIRIFGLSKPDTCMTGGDARSRIRVRLIGGSGRDAVMHQARHLRLRVYDQPEGMIVSGRSPQKHLNNSPYNNSFDRTDWNLDRQFYFLSPAYFTDEGFGLTFTYWLTHHGFRADPYKAKHSFALSYFFSTEAFIGKYTGEWRHVVGDLDLGLLAYLSGPTYTQFFYGLGNRYTDYGFKKNYHIVSGSQFLLAPSLVKRFGAGNRISVTPSYHHIDIEEAGSEPRFVYTPASGINPEDFGRQSFLGLAMAYRFERIDNPGYPTRGIDFRLETGIRASVGKRDIQHVLASFETSLYLPFNVLGSVVLATHIGADKIFGEYTFFQALTLGGPDKLRGFRMDRFAGEARFYHATDLRILLINKPGSVPFRMGLYGAIDYGRVWYERDKPGENRWHSAVGGGLFVVPLGLTSFRIGYMQGEQDKQINIGGSLRF